MSYLVNHGEKEAGGRRQTWLEGSSVGVMEAMATLELED